MKPSRRFWMLTSASGISVVLGMVTDRAMLLAGGAGLAALLVVVQLQFMYRLHRLDTELTVQQTVSRSRLLKEETTTLTLAASIPTGTLPVQITSSLPPSIRSADRPVRIVLSRERTETRTTTTLTFPVVGTVPIDDVTVEVRDEYGLFHEQFRRGPSVTVTVEPRQPRDVHVGQGGDRTTSTLGGHRSGQLGQGIDPAEIREYVAGDAVRDIDWKATARLADPHVREYEVETDRRTLLFVDHRESLGVGTEGETMLAYQRAVALALAASARDLDDPLGLHAVGDGGTTVEMDPSTNPRQYELLRTRLLDLTPTTTRGDAPSDPDVARTDTASPARKASRLRGDTAFETTLRPYLDAGRDYRRRIDERPLLRTVQTQLTRLEGSVWSVLFTDDTNRAELLDAVTLARRGNNRVTVFLTPRALFEPGGLADIEAAYDRYSDFEQFRRTLDGLQNVTAYEVAPSDRIEALLDTRRRVRQ